MIFITRLISYNNYNSFSGCDVVVSAQMAPINNGDSMTVHVLGSLQTISYSSHQDRAPIRSIGNINAKDYVQGPRTIAGTMVFAMFHEHWMTPLLKELESHISNTDIWSDELPAINLTVSMANEYGYKSNMVIYGVKFVDDGGVMSINDLYTENTLQYVATGIQPLKSSGQYQHTHNTKISPFKISDYKPFERAWSWTGFEEYDKQWVRDPYDIEVDNSTIIPDRYPFEPEIFINKPIVKEDDAIVNIYIPNNKDDNINNNGSSDNITNLYLHNLSTGDIYDAMHNPHTNTWTLEVPPGNYNMQLEDIYGNYITGFDPIYVEYSEALLPYFSCPVIVDITDTNVVILSNNPQHDRVEVTELISGTLENEFIDTLTDNIKIYEIASHTSIGQANSKEILIENLQPNTKYTLRTLDSKTGNKSYEVIFQTFSVQDETNNMLIEYIKNNSNLSITALSDINLKDAEFEYSNLIDSLLCLEDSSEKTELLLYATKLQNELNKSYNNTGNQDHVSNNPTNPLVNTFVCDENVESLIIYERKNNKNYFVTRASASSDFQYNGKDNTRYFVQPILKDNKKSAQNDFICYTQEQKSLLSPYSKTNTLSKVSFINYDHRYDKYSEKLKSAIKAVNNLDLYKNLLSQPWAHIYNETLVVDIDYSEFNIDKLYLCIATPQDALDYTPIRKVDITDMKEVVLNKYQTGILKDKHYLIWLQDENFNNISSAFIVSSSKEDLEVDSFNFTKCSDKIKEVKQALPNDSLYKTYIDNLMLSLIAQEKLKYKDMEYFIIQSLLDLYGDQMSQYTLDEMILNIINTYSASSNFTTKLYYDEDIVSFKSNNANHYISYINITNENITKGMCNNDYNRNIATKGYTLIFVSNKTNNYRSGYVLINNTTKEVYKSNIDLEMIKNGC